MILVTTARADVVPEGVRARAARLVGSIVVDGSLTEAVWHEAPKQSGFTQRFPKDGIKATLETRFAVLYDDKAIYVGVWADDPEPDKIRRLLTRRDVDSPSDVIAVGFDSYHDRRTAFVFQLNAAGVQRDQILFDDSKEDTTWDAVWTGDAAITATGWTAEFRIPLNQLRFSTGDAQEWGMQVVRAVSRTQEQASWSPWPRSGDQIVSRFGIVDGISRLSPGRRLELLPYASGGFDVMPVEAGDPLNDPRNMRGNIGLDVKYGLTSAFTLSATINPDFGQVEADPSQINLSANELFFAEKRPFFLEGVDLFKLPIGNSDNNQEGTFYSRRIGAAPDLPDADYDYIRAPTSTTIYGAMKLSGKTERGWSLGVFDAITGSEEATLSGAAGMSDVIVAPLTNYAVGRLKRDLNDGDTAVGLSATSVHRALADTPLASKLHDQAYTVGAQVSHRFTPAWQLELSTVGSLVHGTKEAIAETQLSTRHLYQRPDATNATFDPNRTALSGVGATWKVGRYGDTKHWRTLFGGDIRTIGLELNDMGFQHHSDRAIPFYWVEYRDDDPGESILNWRFSNDVFLVTTLEPQATDYGWESNGNVQFSNYWSVNFNSNLANGVVEPGALRGGASLQTDPNFSGSIGVNTDNRKPIQLFLGTYGNRTWASGSAGGGFDIGATIHARSNIDVYVGPSFSRNNNGMQYIDQVDDSDGMRHYVFGRIKQTTTSLTMRLDWTFTPRLALQAYAQPFVATGRYSQLKDVDNPRAERFEDRFTAISGSDYTLRDDVYTVTAPSGATYSFDRPDFDFRQLRSTLVIRWEYRPGSTVFAIWSHGRTSSIVDGRFRLGNDVSSLVDTEGENVVMVKANYWIGL